MIAVLCKGVLKCIITTIKVELLADLLSAKNSAIIMTCKLLDYFLNLLVRDLRSSTRRLCLSVWLIDKISC